MSGARISHTEAIWRNWPLRVEVTRDATLSDDLTEIASRRLFAIVIRHGDETVIRLDWHDASALRSALSEALDATADLNGEEPLAEWERQLLADQADPHTKETP